MHDTRAEAQFVHGLKKKTKSAEFQYTKPQEKTYGMVRAEDPTAVTLPFALFRGGDRSSTSSSSSSRSSEPEAIRFVLNSGLFRSTDYYGHEAMRLTALASRQCSTFPFTDYISR